MKTGLVQQKKLIEEIQAVTLIAGIKKLREFLKDNGYEDAGDCKHYAVVRTTGKCMNCPTIVTEPIITDSDEALEALRTRLRRD